MGSPGLDHATAVCKHLNASNFKHGAKLGASTCAMTGDRRGARGHDHSKGGARSFQTAAEHEAVTGFEKVEEGWHSRERELTDEDGGVQASMAFVALHCIPASSISIGEGSEYWRRKGERAWKEMREGAHEGKG